MGNEEQEVPAANQGGRGKTTPQAWADLLQVTGLGQSHGLGASVYHVPTTDIATCIR
ncbi:hypothetical protein DAPPUDRAFT_339154 [Daphnia pulex]|uniref:Uncharacterized protein n=1 Tax=Daphnia pulex TaxID=6669 RepID=E9I3B1_DAPPU|nr:hypothetical protein DAPPUDRAFT_339154 [Daphnia pulex]|eukprot:EFX61519.1 hypothetical protein DAPPUDRAFT_339154 [Daphnia pulex]